MWIKILDELTIADVLMIMAVLLGPVLAIQATRFLDDRNEKRNRKLKLFKTLMSTRSYRTTWDHVRTLNSIDLEFNTNNAEEKKVVVEWKAYLNSLKDKSIDEQHISDKRDEHFVNLLSEMAIILKYDFDKTYIKTSSYIPIAHSNIDVENELIRKGLIDILYRGRPLHMFTTNIETQAEL